MTAGTIGADVSVADTEHYETLHGLVDLLLGPGGAPEMRSLWATRESRVAATISTHLMAASVKTTARLQAEQA